MTTESPEVRAAAEAACEFAETIPNYTALTMPACLAECWMHFQRLAKAWRSRTAPGPAWPKGATMMHDEDAVSAAIERRKLVRSGENRYKVYCPEWFPACAGNHWTEEREREFSKRIRDDEAILADACEHYRRELARLRDERGDGWRPISTAPKDGRPFLGYYELCEECHVLCFRDDGRCYSIMDDLETDMPWETPEWWQHLPPPPTGITLDAAEGGGNASRV